MSYESGYPTWAAEQLPSGDFCSSQFCNLNSRSKTDYSFYSFSFFFLFFLFLLSILSLSSFSAFSTDQGLMVTKTRLSSAILSSFFMQNLTPLSNSLRHSLSSHFITFCTFCPIVLTHFITAFHPISCYCSNLFLLSVFCSLF